jgi:transcriptional regulator of met regulon
MKITIDLEDRHTIDGQDYVRILAVNDSPPPVDSVKVTERHTRSVEMVRHGRKERLLPEASPRPTSRDEVKAAADLVKQRNLDYEDRAAAQKALEVMRKKNKMTEHVVEENIGGRTGSQWTEPKVKKLIEMYQAGHPYTKIAKELGVPAGTLGYRIFTLRQKGLLPKLKKDMGAE